MIAAEQQRLEKEREYHQVEISYRQLQYLLDRLNSYMTQATLITGFAFTAFSAEALKDLPYDTSPIRSYFFCFFCALSMSLAICTVQMASHISIRAEKLAMKSSVTNAVAALRIRMRTVFWFHALALLSLFGSAVCLQLAMCHTEENCEGTGYMVAAIFATVCGVTAFIHINDRREFNRYESFDAVSPSASNSGATLSNALLAAPDSAGAPRPGTDDASRMM